MYIRAPRTFPPRRIVRSARFAALALLPLGMPSACRATFTTQYSQGATQFAERTAASGFSRPVPSADVSTLTHQESTAVPNGGDFGGGHTRIDDVSGVSGVQLLWSGLSLANNDIPGQIATLHSHGWVDGVDLTTPEGLPASDVDFGIWAGVHGYLSSPPNPATGQTGFVSLNLSTSPTTLIWDSTYSPYYMDTDTDSVQIASDFTSGAGSFVHASSYSDFQFLNPEHTEFVAFGLSRVSAEQVYGVVAAEIGLDLDVTAGPGTRVELIAPPTFVPLPAFGGGVGSRQGAPVPEPGAILLLAMTPIAFPLARLRRRR